MGAPKIKIYKLDRGYTEDNDNDIQQNINNELLPIKDKPITPEDAYLLTGVKEFSEELTPIVITIPQQSQSLVPDFGQFQTPQYMDNAYNILITENESFKVKVFDHELNNIEESKYSVTPSGINFTEAPYPSGARIDFWYAPKSGTTVNTYISSNNNVYDGDNIEFRELLYDDGDFIDRSDYEFIKPSGLIVFLNGDMSTIQPSGTYFAKQSVTDTYIAEHCNWVDRHMYMNPDIFVGMYDYPGDDTQDGSGNPIVQGPIPKYVEPDNYQLNMRRGMVKFPEDINSDTDPVHASYAYVCGVLNTTSQKLDYIGEQNGKYVYKAVTDKIYSESIGSMWIKGKTEKMPKNIYINGVLTPQIKTIAPYDTLQIKTGQ